MQGLRVEPLHGAELADALPSLAELRIEVFRAFPYLYDGRAAYERRYLETYAATPGAVVVGAFDGSELVGAATALPLRAEPEELKAPVTLAGLDVERVLYFGRSVLRPAYRGRGVGVAFFEERERHARALSGITDLVFCAVIRAADDPRRPRDYQPLDGFWQKRGFRPLEGAIGSIAWRELEEAEDSPKRMQFWHKTLA